MLTVSHEYLSVSSFNATAKRTLRGMILGSTCSEELKIRTMHTSFDEPPIAVSKLLNLAVHCPSKVWPVGMIARKICSKIERNDFKIHYTTGHFISKKYLILVFYDNRNLKISKSKKSEQYFRDKIEIFIRLFDKHFASHFKSYWRERWRHTGGRTVPQISLETPPPPSPPRSVNSLVYVLCKYI